MMSVVFHQPETLQQAVALGDRYGDKAKFVAGGTDLVVQMNRQRLAPEQLISLRGLAGMDGIECDGSHYAIGALTTHKTLERFSEFKHSLSMLPEAARLVGGHQVRNVGTVGGNIANASPAADVVVPLLALDAFVHLSGPAGERSVSLAQFIRGPGKTDRRHAEVITKITFKRTASHTGSAFLKAGRRRAMEISMVCAAARLTLNPKDGTCHSAAIALGAAGPTALRCPRAELTLVGKPPSEETFRAAGESAMEECAPISDVRASADYRRMIVGVLVERALIACGQRAADHLS